ncbi:MAG: 7-carboxy-7-deazaguanine synthase QueE [Firmicutes bacterium]|nr:7-carboxy-7-deazaguanine synthase QueE [Bacillota bacterium]MBE3590464.1 7-carboxy-7-deazaguanine synthase QueE [Bacillota bacterium]
MNTIRKRPPAAEAQLRVSEIFTSIQGEGVRAGYLCTFVRFQGCSVGCEWCDTKYTWDFFGGTPMTREEIYSRIETPNVVLTGGEPLQQPKAAMLAFVSGLKERGHFVQVETSGRFYAPWVAEVDWRTVSPKPPTYEIAERLRPLVDELKYVVDNTFTEDRVEPLPRCTVSLQPEGNKPEYVAKALEILRRHPEWRLSVQIHKFLGLA